MTKEMVSLSEHPTVKRFYGAKAELTRYLEESTVALDADWLRQLCFDEGADDVGFVEIDRAELALTFGKCFPS